MANPTKDHLKVEVIDVVDHQSVATDEDVNDIEMKIVGDGRGVEGQAKPHDRAVRCNDDRSECEFGIRATFAPSYNSEYDVRMKMTMHGRICGERLIEKSRIHNVEGHTIFIRKETKVPRADSHSPYAEKGQSAPHTVQRSCY